jgi:hypothetical protein
MCKNAQKTIPAFLAVAQTAVVNLLTQSGTINTAEGQQIVKDFATVEGDIASWTPGSPAQDAVQVLNDIAAALPLIPLPPLYETIASVALGLVVAAIGLFSGNGAVTDETGAVVASPTKEQIQAHALHTMAETSAKIKTIVPDADFSVKRAALLLPGHEPADQAKKFWNKKVDENKELPPALKIA